MVILAAVDGETVPDPVVTVGNDLATAFGDDLAVLHVMAQDHFDERHEASTDSSSSVGGFSHTAGLAPELSYGGGRNSGSSRNVYTIDAAQEDARSVARGVVEETLGEDAAVSVLGRVGDPDDVIPRELDRQDARYLVIGGRKRSPVGKAIFGSITQSVLMTANRPVMTVMEASDE